MDEFEIDGRHPIYIVPNHQEINPETLEHYEAATIDATSIAREPEAAASISANVNQMMEYNIEIPVSKADCLMNNDVDLCMSCAYDPLSCDSSAYPQMRFYGQDMNVCCCRNYKPLWSQMPEFQCGYEQAMRELNSPRYVEVWDHYDKPPTYICPRCEYGFYGKQDEKRCPRCGQKLKWDLRRNVG